MQRCFVTSVVALAFLVAACGRLVGVGDLQPSSEDAGNAGVALSAAVGGERSVAGGAGGVEPSMGGVAGLVASGLPGRPAGGGLCPSQWITLSGGFDVPVGAVEAGQEPSAEAPSGIFHLYVCRVTRQDAVLMGEWREGLGCYFSDGSAEHSSADYDLLTASGCLSWYPPAPSGPMIPALVGGHLLADLLYVCRADDGSGVLHPGYMGAPTNYKCRIASQHTAKDFSSFELLVP